jgi:hypothetical protein
METTNVVPFKKDYEGLVEQGKQVVNKQENINWELGELALNVVSEYGEGTLYQFAEDIGVNYSTLQACVATVKAWPQKLMRISFWRTHQALNAHPDRYKIMADNPGISSRQALALMREYRASLAPEPSKTWPPERIAKMTERLNDGLTYKEVGIELGVSPGAISGKWAKEVEKKSDPAMRLLPPSMPDDIYQQVLRHAAVAKSHMHHIESLSIYVDQMHEDARHAIATEAKIIYDLAKATIKRLVGDPRDVKSPQCGVEIKIRKDVE